MAIRQLVNSSTRQFRGFSLLELLVVVAIIAILMAMLVPGLSRARSAARQSVCAANLHNLGLGVNIYIDSFGELCRYSVDSTAPAGRFWWFGFEPNGPGTGANRPLDRTRSPLAAYVQNFTDQLQCKEFPYEDPGYFPKFSQHAASYGININLTPVNGLTYRRTMFVGKETSIMLFADGLQFDFNPGFNEAAYLSQIPAMQGYAHFRHQKKAQVAFLDGHVDSQSPTRGIIKTIAGSPVGHLAGQGNPDSIYTGTQP